MGQVIGIDLGGTKVAAGLVGARGILSTNKQAVRADLSEQSVLEDIYSVLEPFDFSSVAGLGVGVPGTVDPDKGIVYDIQNIPSWKEVPLKSLLEERYGLPVYLNNDSLPWGSGSLAKVGTIELSPVSPSAPGWAQGSS